MQTSKIDRKQSEIRHFSKILNAENTSWWGNETVAGKMRFKRRLNMMIDYVNPSPAVRILELGCGDGNGTLMLAKTHARIVAVDLSSDLVEKAKQKVKFNNVEFRVLDAEKLPFKDKTFDAVVGNSILHHLDVCEVLKEVKRVIRPGGKIAFCEPNLMNPQIFIERKVRFIGRILQVSPFETAFMRKPLKRTVESFGFNNVSVEPFDFLHPAIPKAFVKYVSKLSYVLEKFYLLREFAGSLFINAIA